MTKRCDRYKGYVYLCLKSSGTAKLSGSHPFNFYARQQILL